MMYRSDDEISNRPDWNAQAYRAYLSCTSLKNNWESRKSFFECYRGEWNSEEAYAEDFYESIYGMDRIPEELRSHIDWESYSNDLFQGECYSDDSSDRGVFVFVNC